MLGNFSGPVPFFHTFVFFLLQAPEGLLEQKFSSASDVWGFAMTCVEILQDGGLPWPGTRSNPAVMAMVTGGEVHPRPDGCGDKLYAKVRLPSFAPRGPFSCPFPSK